MTPRFLVLPDQDAHAVADKVPYKVMDAAGIICDKPGFELDFITRDNASYARHNHALPSVPLPVKG